MPAPQTAVAAEVTELLILWPRLYEALARDEGAGMDAERVTGGTESIALPINADVSAAVATLHEEVPTLAYWAAGVVAEPHMSRTLDDHLAQIPRWHERMLVTAAAEQAAQLARSLHGIVRQVKLALGLRTPDRHLGQYCPLHDDPLRELVAPGDVGTLRYRSVDRDGRPVEPVVEWDRRDAATCRVCHASWAPGDYMLLQRQLREADMRRVSAAVEGAA
jgi:hypothetical protein